MGQIRTRPVDRSNDFEQLRGLDISVETDRMFQVDASAGSELKLVSVKIASSVEKRFPLNLDSDPWSDGWVVEEDSRIRGFIGCGNSEWNRRLAIWHFYVDRTVRNRGLGRRLMDCALSRAREWGARTAWAETSNLNYPGVCAYQKLGFELCGFDTTLYRGTPGEGEFALFLAREV
jgi:ribosomal protein S18 acetylase RimI-like enzyme